MVRCSLAITQIFKSCTKPRFKLSQRKSKLNRVLRRSIQISLIKLMRSYINLSITLPINSGSSKVSNNQSSFKEWLRAAMVIRPTTCMCLLVLMYRTTTHWTTFTSTTRRVPNSILNSKMANTLIWTQLTSWTKSRCHWTSWERLSSGRLITSTLRDSRCLTVGEWLSSKATQSTSQTMPRALLPCSGTRNASLESEDASRVTTLLTYSTSNSSSADLIADVLHN